MKLTIEKVKNGFLLMVEAAMWDPSGAAAWAPLYDTMLEKAHEIQEAKADPEMARIRRENGDEPATGLAEEFQRKQMEREAQNPSGIYIFQTYPEALAKATEILEKH